MWLLTIFCTHCSLSARMKRLPSLRSCMMNCPPASWVALSALRISLSGTSLRARRGGEPGRGGERAGRREPAPLGLLRTHQVSRTPCCAFTIPTSRDAGGFKIFRLSPTGPDRPSRQWPAADQQSDGPQKNKTISTPLGSAMRNWIGGDQLADLWRETAVFCIFLR